MKEASIMSRASTKTTKSNHKRPKLNPGLPDLENSKMTVLRSLRAPASRRSGSVAKCDFVERCLRIQEGYRRSLDGKSGVGKDMARNRTGLLNCGCRLVSQYRRGQRDKADQGYHPKRAESAHRLSAESHMHSEPALPLKSNPHTLCLPLQTMATLSTS